MESKGYEARDRSLVGTLAGLTYGILNHGIAAQNDKMAVGEPESVPHRGLLDWLDTWFWEQELKSREAFLAQSTDVIELEQRMRWLERGHN